jgi:hypothetical protein
VTLPKLQLEPAQDGYSADDGPAVLSAQPSKGPMRLRLDQPNAPPVVNVTFRLNPVQFAYWRAFLRTTIAKGSLPFTIDLLIDSPIPQEYEARIIPGSVRLAGVDGMRHIVQATLEVRDVPGDIGYDETLVWLFDAYGEGASDILNLLAKLVNEDMGLWHP